MKRDCFEIVDEEVQTLVDEGFVIKVARMVFSPQSSVYSKKSQASVDSSCKGHDGLSLHNHLENGPNYVNSLPNAAAARRWDEVAYAGDIWKMLNQVLVHLHDQVFHRFLRRKNQHDLPTMYQSLRLNFWDKPAPDIACNAINILAKASQDDFPETAKELQERTYVDAICVFRPSRSQLQLTKCSGKVKAWLSWWALGRDAGGREFDSGLKITEKKVLPS
mgnify:CR=1 FL=1